MKRVDASKRVWTRWLGVLLILTITPLLAGNTLAAPAAPAAKGRFVKAGGHRLYLECAGNGYPIVMLEAGLGDWSRGWGPILARSKKIGTTVCAYDRFGLGRSGTAPGARSVEQVVSDLSALVRRAKLRGPYVFGGSSMGGLIARYYANLHPKKVAGMVLFDSVPDDWDAYVGISLFQGGGESLDTTPASARLRKSDRLGRKPLIVLEAGDKSFLDGAVGGRPDFAGFWHSRQQALSRISSNSFFAVARGKPHWIQSAAPNLSAEAFRLVVKSVRSKKPLPPCKKSKLPKLGAACG